MEMLYAVLVFSAMLLPAVLLALWGLARGWPFRRLIPYFLSYGALLSLMLGAVAGVRDWFLGIVVLVGVGVGAVVFYMYAYVVEESEKLRKGRKR